VVEHDGERVRVSTRIPTAIEVDVERLQLGDVILIDLPDQGTNISSLGTNTRPPGYSTPGLLQYAPS
jgi:hypothetical protein